VFLNFKITNYRSVGKELAIDFCIRDGQKLWGFTEINDQAINNITCLVGPNASGKSNILKGIVQFLRCINLSYSNRYYRYTDNYFKTHFCCKNVPIGFSTEFIDNKTQYKYEVSILDGIVQNEILQKRDETTKRYSYLFNREIGNNISFCKAIKINKRDLNRLGDDMSLLSLMLELNYFEESEFLLIKKFHTNVYNDFLMLDNVPGLRLGYLSKILQNDSNLMDELIDELKAVDTGISSIELKKNKQRFRDPESREVTIEHEGITIFTSHKIANNDYPLILSEESGGTLHYIETFIFLSKVMQNGGLFIADELEQSLHPDLTARIINRFIDKDKNPNNAQLLFTTHNPWFLQDLTKTQIFITEKNEKAETEIIRLDEIGGVRNDENYFVKYISGEYDGRPKIREN